jgi:PilZ domain
LTERPSYATERRRGQDGKSDRSNRRAFPRWPLQFEVRYGTGKELAPAEGCEIGEGGLSFHTSNPLPLGTEFNVEYRLTPEHPWNKIKAIVKHRGKGFTGAEFLNLRMRDRLEIVRVIAERK